MLLVEPRLHLLDRSHTAGLAREDTMAIGPEQLKDGRRFDARLRRGRMTEQRELFRTERFTGP